MNIKIEQIFFVTLSLITAYFITLGLTNDNELIQETYTTIYFSVKMFFNVISILILGIPTIFLIYLSLRPDSGFSNSNTDIYDNAQKAKKQISDKFYIIVFYNSLELYNHFGYTILCSSSTFSIIVATVQILSFGMFLIFIDRFITVFNKFKSSE